MKFSEKLQTLRKEKKLSQEQLADMLDVSRQSVSKWESGQTYPEMDKLIELSKIFKCTLDDLTNDDVKTITSKEKDKGNISNLVYGLLDLIKRSYEMLKKMTFKNILGCILEMLFVIIALVIFHNVVDYIYYLGENIFIYLGKASGIICNIWNALLEIIYIILSVIIFVYIYKIRYLDRYEKIEKIEKVEDKNDVVDNVKEEKKLKKEEKVVIKQEKSFKFLDILGSVFMFFVKLFILFVSIPFIITLVTLGMFLIISIVLLFSGVTYFGIFLVIISSLFLNLVFLYMVYYFIFNKKIDVKKSLIVILSSLILFGIGIGISAIEIANTNFTNNVSSIAKEEKIEKTFKMSDNLVIYPNFNTYYEIDDTLKDTVRIEVYYYDKFNKAEIKMINNNIYIDNSVIDSISSKYLYNMVLTDLKTKNIHNYYVLTTIKVKVITSGENIKILDNNLNNMRYDEEVNYFEDRIDELQEELEEVYSNKNKLDERINELEYENSELKNKINYYKESLNSIINE